MKKLLILSLVSISFIVISCGKRTSCVRGETDSFCVNSKIKEFSGVAQCSEGTNVKEYRFQGKSVFVFENGTCGNDIASEVIDSECNSLGFLGGFAGNTKINGEDFSNATFVKTVWER